MCRYRFSFQKYHVCGLKWAPEGVELNIHVTTHIVTLISYQIGTQQYPESHVLSLNDSKKLPFNDTTYNNG